MGVRWPDGDVTGSVRAEEHVPTPATDPEPETNDPAEKSDQKKEVKDGAR